MIEWLYWMRASAKGTLEQKHQCRVLLISKLIRVGSLNLENIPLTREDLFNIFNILNGNKTLIGLKSLNLKGQNLGRLPVEKFKKILNIINSFPLIDLDLSSNSLDNQYLIILLSSLKYSEYRDQLKILSLGFNLLNNQGIRYLSEFLKRNKTLHIVNLEGNLISNQGAIDLSIAFAYHSALRSIQLHSDFITDEGAIAFVSGWAKSSSLILNINLRYLSEHALDRIAYLISKIKDRSVQIEANSLHSASQRGIACLKQALEDNNGFIKVVTLLKSMRGTKDNAMMSELAKALNGMSTLCLSYAELSLEDFKNLSKALKQNNTLSMLSLKGTHLSDESILALTKGLKKNTTLKFLNLANNQLSANDENKGIAAIATFLKQHPKLLMLNLKSNHITDEGAISLAGALGKNKYLQILKLSHNKISARGAHVLAKFLANNRFLQVLILSDNPIEENGIINLFQSFVTSSVHLLDLSLNKMSLEGFEKISKYIGNVRDRLLTPPVIGYTPHCPQAKEMILNAMEQNQLNVPINNVPAMILSSPQADRSSHLELEQKNQLNRRTI